ncbi:hypothetical protein [Streptomyces caeruleatus]|uniref:hypothetical protein n=1 Tax=Streptomyces caeruleatus TaxID=661399 RepID=UPI000B1006D4|nr:hypothetical protein [Streptomyces caeruleatus]
MLDEEDSRLGGSSGSVAVRVEVVALPMLAAALMTRALMTINLFGVVVAAFPAAVKPARDDLALRR